MSNSEKALKLVSDQIAEEDDAKAGVNTTPTENSNGASENTE